MKLIDIQYSSVSTFLQDPYLGRDILMMYLKSFHIYIENPFARYSKTFD